MKLTPGIIVKWVHFRAFLFDDLSSCLPSAFNFPIKKTIKKKASLPSPSPQRHANLLSNGILILLDSLSIMHLNLSLSLVIKFEENFQIPRSTKMYFLQC